MNRVGGQIGFDEYYRSVFSQRWEDLRAALHLPAVKKELKNIFAESDSSLEPFYALDPASEIVALELGVEPGHRVLDMCAAPGGKSLVSIFSVNGDADFTLNDLSRERVKRLRRVIREHIPASVSARIRITTRDASRWGVVEKEAYDRILLDAPCSGERHLLENKSELEHWNLKRLKGLQQRQYALLCSGMLALRPGGRLVYSTCALTPLEDDEVIRRFMSKKGEGVTVCRPKTAHGEETEFGTLIAPDRENGWGPMYFSILEK